MRQSESTPVVSNPAAIGHFLSRPPGQNGNAEPASFARFLGAPDQRVVAAFWSRHDGLWCFTSQIPGEAIPRNESGYPTFGAAFAAAAKYDRAEPVTHEPPKTVAVIVRNAAGECELRTETQCCAGRSVWVPEPARQSLSNDWIDLTRFTPGPPPGNSDPAKAPTDRLLHDIASAPAEPARAMTAGVVDPTTLDDAACAAAERNERATGYDADIHANQTLHKLMFGEGVSRLLALELQDAFGRGVRAGAKAACDELLKRPALPDDAAERCVAAFKPLADAAGRILSEIRTDRKNRGPKLANGDDGKPEPFDGDAGGLVRGGAD